MERHRKALCLALLLAASATPLGAEPSEAIETRLEARRVIHAADGGESLAPAESAKPGDVIEYVAIYRNTGSQPVRNLVATLPIPAHTEWVPGSARPANAEASRDAREFAAPPLKRIAKREGQAVEEQVPYGEYRYLRWYAPELGGAQTLRFSARVKVVE